MPAVALTIVLEPRLMSTEALRPVHVGRSYRSMNVQPLLLCVVLENSCPYHGTITISQSGDVLVTIQLYHGKSLQHIFITAQTPSK